MSDFFNTPHPEVRSGPQHRVTVGATAAAGGAALWVWMVLGAGAETLPIAVLAGPIVPLGMGLHLLLGGQRSQALGRWVPLLAVFVIVATLVFCQTPEARGTGLVVAMLSVFAGRWTTDADSVRVVGGVATAILAVLFVAQGAPAVFVLAAIAPVAVGVAVRHSQNQLRETQISRQELIQRLHLALSQGQAGSFDLNLETGHTEYSPRFREVLGYDGFSAFPPLPDLLECSELVWHEDAPILERAISAARRTGALVDEELRFIGASGQPVWVRLRALPRAHASRRVNRLSGTILDVSAQHQADERTEAFLLAASRQIRAPLTSIRGVHRLLQSGAFGDLPDLAQRMVSMADRNGGHLEQLIEHLMDLRRIQHRPHPFVLEPTALDGRVRAAVSKVDTEHAHLLQVAMGQCDSDVIVSAHGPRLQAAVEQLLSIGSDHLTGPAQTHVCVVRRSGTVELTIERVGLPADAPVHTSVAGLLERDEEPPMDDAESLALAVTRARLLAMGAWIRASSTAAGVLTMTVTFPACTDALNEVAVEGAERAS